MSQAHAAAHGHGHDNSGHSGDYVHHPHVLPARLYVTIFVSLLILTYITVRASYFNFGEWNIIIAMAIASTKASLVALFFMHLKYDERFNGVIFVSAFVFLSLFFIFTLSDTSRRGEVDPLEKGTILVLPESSIPHHEGEGAVGHEGAAMGSVPGATGHEAAAGAEGAAPAGGAAPTEGTETPAGEHGEPAPAESTTGGH